MDNDSSDQDLEDKTKKRKRNRSCSFKYKETILLLDLIYTHKLCILNKSSTGTVNRSKDIAWDKIAKVLNGQQLGPRRNPEHLKSKWASLKQSAKNITTDALEHKDDTFKAIYNKIIELMQIGDSLGSVDIPAEILEMSTDTVIENDVSNSKPKEVKKNRHRSLNFRPEECTLLLKCVRLEKEYIFSKEITATALELKNNAWARIAENYNRLSPTKRSAKVLRDKLKNLKKTVKKIGFKSHYPGADENNLEIKVFKLEPDCNLELEREGSDDCMDNDPPPPESPQSDKDFSVDFNAVDDDNDPLSSVLNCDSGTGSTHAEPSHISESNNPFLLSHGKMNTELLKLQLENAKLEQKRLAQIIAEDESSREARAIQSALRLRTARLEAIAAANKFPAGHPALHFTDLEAKAQYYLGQFDNA